VMQGLFIMRYVVINTSSIITATGIKAVGRMCDTCVRNETLDPFIQ
jgi:hypothetical protein